MAQAPIALRMLHEEHEQVDRLLGQLMAQEGDLDEVRRALHEELCRHMAAEEQVFYAALDRLEMLASFVSRLRDQHARLRESVSELVACDLADRTRFRATTLHLNRLFDEHIEDEEGRGFAYAVEHLATDLDAIAVELEHSRSAARGAYGVG